MNAGRQKYKKSNSYAQLSTSARAVTAQATYQLIYERFRYNNYATLSNKFIAQNVWFD